MEAFTKDPLLANGYVREVSERVRSWDRALAVAPLAMDPFRGQTVVGKTWREAVLASRDFEPIRSHFISHLDYLLERRLNLGVCLEESVLLTESRHEPRAPFDLRGTWSEWRQLALTMSVEPGRSEAARAAFRALQSESDRLSAVRVLRHERIVEIEGRLGARLSPLVSWEEPEPPEEAPGPEGRRLRRDSSELARLVLADTRDLSMGTFAPGWAGVVHAATGFPAVEGWPARLVPETLLELLGGPWLVAETNPGVSDLPARLCPASFLRGAARLGRQLVRAAAPQSVPFVVARTPTETYGRAFGRLLARCLLTPTFARRRLGLGPEGRARHARGAAQLLLAESRVLAARALLAEAGRRSRTDLDHTWGEVEMELAGESLGRPLGLLAAPPDANVDFVAHLWALRMHAELVRRYDEDFLDNPRAREELVAALHAREPALPEHSVLLRTASELAQSVTGSTA